VHHRRDDPAVNLGTDAGTSKPAEGIAHSRNTSPPPVVLNVERGCVAYDPITGLWTITGRKFNGARDSEGDKIPEGQVRDDPWVHVARPEQSGHGVQADG
jgi:hypothetical protein